MNKINEILEKYTTGEATLDETNKALKDSDSKIYLDLKKNAIKETEIGKYGLLDTGTGSLDKVLVVNGTIDMDCGDMYALCIFDGKTYTVKGKTLVE